jgi:deazaflavin-dependent oxidoreductase (nitroreductase family)
MSVLDSVEKAVLRVGVQALKVHQEIYVRSGGRIGHRFPFAPPSLILRTVGNKTGLPRVNALTYANDGDDVLIVPSNGGASRAPGWFFNLQAEPKTQIQLGTETRSVTARTVWPEDPGYDRLWQIVNANNSNRYRFYQRRTDRPIPVVVLSR